MDVIEAFRDTRDYLGFDFRCDIAVILVVSSFQVAAPTTSWPHLIMGFSRFFFTPSDTFPALSKTEIVN